MLCSHSSTFKKQIPHRNEEGAGVLRGGGGHVGAECFSGWGSHPIWPASCTLKGQDGGQDRACNFQRHRAFLVRERKLSAGPGGDPTARTHAQHQCRESRWVAVGEEGPDGGLPGCALTRPTGRGRRRSRRRTSRRCARCCASPVPPSRAAGRATAAQCS